GAVVRRTCARGGKIVTPTFALERAQEVIYELKRLRQQGRIPAVPVFVDSPLTVKLTDVFRLHPECHDAARALLDASHSPFEFAGAARARGPLRRVILVHGEPPAQAALAAALGARGFPTFDIPGSGDRLRL